MLPLLNLTCLFFLETDQVSNLCQDRIMLAWIFIMLFIFSISSEQWITFSCTEMAVNTSSKRQSPGPHLLQQPQQYHWLHTLTALWIILLHVVEPTFPNSFGIVKRSLMSTGANTTEGWSLLDLTGVKQSTSDVQLDQHHLLVWVQKHFPSNNDQKYPHKWVYRNRYGKRLVSSCTDIVHWC